LRDEIETSLNVAEGPVVDQCDTRHGSFPTDDNFRRPISVLAHVHYFIGLENVVLRPGNSKMAPVSFAIFAFLMKIASRAPDFFHIPRAGRRFKARQVTAR
jgi:hypothetical protein